MRRGAPVFSAAPLSATSVITGSPPSGSSPMPSPKPPPSRCSTTSKAWPLPPSPAKSSCFDGLGVLPVATGVGLGPAVGSARAAVLTGCVALAGGAVERMRRSCTVIGSRLSAGDHTLAISRGVFPVRMPTRVRTASSSATTAAAWTARSPPAASRLLGDRSSSVTGVGRLSLCADCTSFLMAAALFFAMSGGLRVAQSSRSPVQHSVRTRLPAIAAARTCSALTRASLGGTTSRMRTSAAEFDWLEAAICCTTASTTGRSSVSTRPRAGELERLMWFAILGRSGPPLHRTFFESLLQTVNLDTSTIHPECARSTRSISSRQLGRPGLRQSDFRQHSSGVRSVHLGTPRPPIAPRWRDAPPLACFAG